METEKLLQGPVRKTAFCLFVQAQRQEFRLQAGGSLEVEDVAELSPISEADWRALPLKKQQYFEEQATEMNEEVAAMQAVALEEEEEAQGGAAALPSYQMDLACAFKETEGIMFDENQKLVLKLFEEDPETWMGQPVVVMSFTTYAKPDHNLVYLPAEVGISVFTLKDGVVANYARILDPSPVPRDYKNEAATSVGKLGLPDIGSVEELGCYYPLFYTLEGILEKYAGTFSKSSFLPVWCLDSDYLMVSRCLEALFLKTYGHSLYVRVLSLNLYGYLASQKRVGKSADDLVSVYRDFGEPLIRGFKYPQNAWSSAYGVFRDDSEVETVVKDMDNYREHEELSCVYHMNFGRASQCALLAANRYVFGLLEILTLSNQVWPTAGSHFPELTGEPNPERERRIKLLQEWELTTLEKQELELESVQKEEKGEQNDIPSSPESLGAGQSGIVDGRRDDDGAVQGTESRSQ